MSSVLFNTATLSNLLNLFKFPDEEKGLTKDRQAVLTNRIVLLAIILGSVFYSIELLLNPIVAHWVFFSLCSIFSLTIFLNAKCYYTLAKTIGLLMFNILLYLVCGSKNYEGVYLELHFISAALVALMLFGYEGKKFAVTFSIIAMGTYLLSNHYQNSFIPLHHYTSGQITVLFIFNLAIFVVLNFSILFMFLRINAKVEERLRVVNLELLELNDSKDKLFSIIGHDLKGPLNSLSAFSELLTQDALTANETKMLAKNLNQSVDNAKSLLEDLLEWGRSQTGSTEFEPEQLDLAVEVKETLDLLSGIAKDKNINVTSNIQGKAFVNAHRYSINMVVRNLLSNAIKFTREGGSITITIAASSMVTVSVEDTGVGMPASTVQKLFQLGNRVSTLGTAKEKGTGLGLILCKDFVEKNGGTIHVESKEGVGSKFYFTVPKG
jgi:signal transduction histidine kinase